ncbi:MAG: pyridoxamine 5'-phosphate oxidase family protein [Thiotrichaceae bacterium]|nr:pyridoxamine 5'-phosphate oxidase family protein [Thiotrichaceae bacterium]
MGKKFQNISDELIIFISEQKIFFVGTAAASGTVNISPKGMDSLRVLNKNQVIWLNLTGSGSETSAHIQENQRMTLMFCAFEGKPIILRLYGQARVIHKNDSDWEKYRSLLPQIAGARQIFDLTVALVQTSCGMSVPLLTYIEDRDLLKIWAEKSGPEKLEKYWAKNNQISLDGKATHIIDKNT